MRVTTRIVFDASGNVLEHEWYEYVGPVALCDRAAQNSFKQAAGDAGDLAANQGANANAIGATLRPFYQQEMGAQHLFSPDQTNELLTAAGAPIAASGATAQGQANSEAARTRNTAGFSAGLDQAAHDRANSLATANLGVGAQDIMGAKQLNQEGAAGMNGLYGTDTDAQLKAMGLQGQDISGQLDAGKSGWFQNTLAGVNAASGLVGALKAK